MKKYLFTAAVLVIASIFTSCEPEVVAETTPPATEEETTKVTPENGEETPQNKDDEEQETSTEENSDNQSNQKINHGFNLEYTQPELPDNVGEDLFAGYKFELSEWSSDDKERIQSYDFGTDGTYTQTIITTHTDSEGAKYERTTKKIFRYTYDASNKIIYSALQATSEFYSPEFNPINFPETPVTFQESLELINSVPYKEEYTMFKDEEDFLNFLQNYCEYMKNTVFESINTMSAWTESGKIYMYTSSYYPEGTSIKDTILNIRFTSTFPEASENYKASAEINASDSTSKLAIPVYNTDWNIYEQTRFTIINIQEDTIIANYDSKEYKFKYQESCENGVIELSLEAADEITKK